MPSIPASSERLRSSRDGAGTARALRGHAAGTGRAQHGHSVGTVPVRVPPRGCPLGSSGPENQGILGLFGRWGHWPGRCSEGSARYVVALAHGLFPSEDPMTNFQFPSLSIKTGSQLASNAHVESAALIE